MKRLSMLVSLLYGMTILSCSSFRTDEKINQPVVINLNKAGDAASIKTNFAAKNIVGNFRYEENLIAGLASPKLKVEAAFFDPAEKNPMFGGDTKELKFISVGPSIEFFEAKNKAIPANLSPAKSSLAEGEVGVAASSSANINTKSALWKSKLAAAHAIATSEQTDDSSDPSDPSDDPSDPTDDPSDPTDDPSDPSDDPSDPSNDPSVPPDPVAGSAVSVSEQFNSKTGVTYYLTPGNSVDLLPSVKRKHEDGYLQMIRILENDSHVSEMAVPFEFPRSPVKLTGESGKGGVLKLTTGKDFVLTWEPGPNPNSIISISIEIRKEVKGKTITAGNLVINAKDTGEVKIAAKEFERIPDGDGIASVSRVVTGNISVVGANPGFINYKSAFRTLMKGKKGPEEKKK